MKKLLFILFAAAAFWALGLLPFHAADAAKLEIERIDNGGTV